MKVLFGSKGIIGVQKKVLAMGVFDGLHIAHQRLLRRALKKARLIGARAIVLTFWPHPQKEDMLCSLKHRLRLIGALGIDICLVIPFNKRLSRMGPEDFIREVVVKKIRPDFVYVGENFRFGRDAEGNVSLLKKLSRIHGFKLKIFKVLSIDGRPVSSTYIRGLIRKGKLGAAGKLLSRPVGVLGTVTRGATLARKLGFPTANINPDHEIIPPRGIYAVRVIMGNAEASRISKNNPARRKTKFGLCYIGSRATYKKHKKAAEGINIEVHIFNFRGNIYGRYLEVLFIKKIRNEKRFASRFQLIEQIQKDLQQAKRLFSLP